MRLISIVLAGGLIGSMALAGGYMSSLAQSVCPVPLAYRLGTLDERFGISRSEALESITQATAVWQELSAQPLFYYDETAAFTVDFVFDERQQRVEAQATLSDELTLSTKEHTSLQAQYRALVAQYEQQVERLATNTAAFERRLADHNAVVATYNQAGGATAEVFATLTQAQQALETERARLVNQRNQLEQLATEINQLNEQQQIAVSEHNKNVDRFNKQVGQTHEWTQGEYTNNGITVYTFADKTELQAVLVHELGHALSLEHIDNPASIMYPFMGDQTNPVTLTAEDTLEFSRVCQNMHWWDKVWYSISH